MNWLDWPESYRDLCSLTSSTEVTSKQVSPQQGFYVGAGDHISILKNITHWVISWDPSIAFYA